MKLRELRRQCERFTARVIAEGADRYHLAGLLLGAFMREFRTQPGATREKYLEACRLLWDTNSPPDLPVDDDASA